MDYRIMVFIARDRLAALDIGTDGKSDTISIDGNNIMKYSSQKEIKEFCQYIKNYYNIEAFSELTMSISVLRFDAVMKDVFVLLQEIQEAAEYNFLSAEKLLPWIALKEGMLKAGTEIQIKVFDLVYTVSLCHNMIMHCQLDCEKEHSVILSEEKLAEWDHLSKNVFFGNKEEKAELCKKYDEEIKKLKQQLSEEKSNRQAADERFEKIKSIIYEIRDKKERNASRRIIRMQCADKEKADVFSNDYYSTPDSSSNLSGLGAFFALSASIVGQKNRKFVFRLANCCKNAEIVKKRQKIAVVQVYYCYVEDEKDASVSEMLIIGLAENGFEHMCRDSDKDFVIYAAASGRLFWLHEQETKFVYGNDIAVLGDVTDTREDVMKWYEENK